jgi:hypothetical protein
MIMKDRGARVQGGLEEVGRTVGRLATGDGADGAACEATGAKVKVAGR